MEGISPRDNAKWYVLHTLSNYENIAKEDLEAVIVKYNLTERIFDIIIPMEDVIEEKNGKKRLVQRKTMPSYILVKMIYGDDIWHNVVKTRGIAGFAGPKGRPLSLTEDEIAKLRLERVVSALTLEPGDKIEIIDGVIAGMFGTVEQANNETLKAKVVVEMFGKDTIVDLDYTKIRKLNK